MGKIGPVFIQDITDEKGEGTIIIDDATGSPTGISLTQEISTLISKNSLPPASPTRGDNGKPGDSKTPGTKVANTVQQQYFTDVATKVILPLFKERQKPFSKLSLL